MKAKVFFVRRRGSILIETAIGLLLIAIALLGIMATFCMSVNSLTAMRDKEAAMLVALGIMNELEGVELKELNAYVDNLLKSPDHYPGYTIINNKVNDILTLNPLSSTDPVSAEIRIAIRRNGRENGVVLTREVSSSGFRNAGVVN
ncbi:hypothetical protein LJC31_07625 [Synergistaceae bacterium OttesenSCG-928-I11]|nr:hypothetical protein [Synergistaceae bacterium OttesenSCG-928-I11]